MKETSPNGFEQETFQTPTPTKEIKLAPYVGMLFETLEEAKIYYKKYGRQEGFWIRTHTMAKTRCGSKEVTGRLFGCTHSGKHVRKSKKDNNSKLDAEQESTTKDHVKKRGRSRSTMKCDCKASLRVTYDMITCEWKVVVFDNEHNNKFVTPHKRIKMKSNRNMPKAVKDLTEAFQRENLQIGKVASIFGGEHIGFVSRDCYNQLRNVREQQLDGGDAQSVLMYFRKNQAENPQFFYAIQCFEDGRATNFFWVDSRSRMAYQYFGDIVTFDTTYKTNKYEMPFAPSWIPAYNSGTFFAGMNITGRSEMSLSLPQRIFKNLLLNTIKR